MGEKKEPRTFGLYWCPGVCALYQGGWGHTPGRSQESKNENQRGMKRLPGAHDGHLGGAWACTVPAGVMEMACLVPAKQYHCDFNVLA